MVDELVGGDEDDETIVINQRSLICEGSGKGTNS